MKISVIIPCLNEAKYVPKLLKDLSAQKNFTDFEVIVVNSGSEDDTAAVARRFSDQLPLTVIELQQRGASRARNAGAAAAHGEYLLFLDADIRIPRNFLATLWQKHKEHGADMMTVRFTASGIHPFDKIFYKGQSKFFEKSFLTKSPFMTGCVQFTSRQLHQLVGGYKPTQEVGEDIDYSQRIASRAKRPHFVAKLTVKASSRRFKKDGRLTMLLRQYQWVSGNRLENNSVDTFDFGHYTQAKKKVTWLDFIRSPKLRREIIKAAWYLARSV